MAEHFTTRAQEALRAAKEIAEEIGHTYIGSEHLLLGLCRDGESTAAKILESKGLSYGRLQNTVIDYTGRGTAGHLSPTDMTPRLRHILEVSAKHTRQPEPIGSEQLLLAVLEEKDSVAVRILSALGVGLGEVKSDILRLSEKTLGPDARGVPGRDNKLSGLPYLSAHGRDMTHLAAEGKIDPVIGREKETERVIQILSRRQKNNPCLIGEPGVGKTAVVEGLCQRIVRGEVPEGLLDKSVVALDLSSMVAGAKYRGEFEERLRGVMEEAQNDPSILLFLDELHTLVGAGAAEGAVDAANILKPALARGGIRVIGATTTEEYRRHIEHDAALERRFQPVMIEEATREEAVIVLRGLREKYETHHHLTIGDDAIDAAVELSMRYLPDRFLPDKALDLLDEAAARKRLRGHAASEALARLEDELREAEREKKLAVRLQKYEEAAAARDRENGIREKILEEKARYVTAGDDRLVTLSANDIADTLTAQTGIPIRSAGEHAALADLEEKLSEKIVGQADAVRALARAVRRSRAGISDPARPIGSFLFLGPTGVGKTALARALAASLFGSERAMIRLDMSEYAERHSIARLIGPPPGYVGYGEGGQLTERVRKRPYAVVLFDEIEKAHPDFAGILLQILEDGRLTDGEGRVVNFKNTVIILTSNVGSQTPDVRMLGFAGNESESGTERAKDALRRAFPPEFLNRLDEVIVFHRLTPADARAIADRQIGELRERLAKRKIDATFDESVVSKIAESYGDGTYGARPLRRALAESVEDLLSADILNGKIVEGDHIRVYVRGDATIVEKCDVSAI